MKSKLTTISSIGTISLLVGAFCITGASVQGTTIIKSKSNITNNRQDGSPTPTPTPTPNAKGLNAINVKLARTRLTPTPTPKPKPTPKRHN